MYSWLSGILSTLKERVQSNEAVEGSHTFSAWITHYGGPFNDRTLGCYGYGSFSSDDPTIIAVNPTLYNDLPCGSILELCGPGGCLLAARKDSCPGCRPDGLDLSDAGFKQVCGDADGVCTASARVLKVCEMRHFGDPKEDEPRPQTAENRFAVPVPCEHPTL